MRLSWKEAEGVGVVTMARPPVNAFDQAMYQELAFVFGRTDELLPGARVIVLRGEGRHFCGGNDLQEFATMTAANAAERMLAVRRAFWAVHDCPLPVIAAVHGAALGTGLAIAASCDFVIAARGARFGLPEVGVGVMGGARHLARLAPQPVVRWMFFSADPVDVEELLPYGAVLDVVEEDRLDEEAERRARRIARHSPDILRVAKRSLNAIEHLDLKAGYAHEQGLTGELAGTADAIEALHAVLERRPPSFRPRDPIGPRA